MPAEAHWRGRPFLVNELIETCGDSNFLSSDEGGAVIQAIEARPFRDTTPVGGEELNIMQPALRLALANAERLDLHPIFAQLGILDVESLQRVTEGAVGREVSILQLPLNISLKEAGEKSLGYELVESLLADCLGELPAGRKPGQAAPAVFQPHSQGKQPCWLYGKEGGGPNGQWMMMKKEEKSLPGSRADTASKEASSKKPVEPADVILMKGDAPLVIAVPHGGRKGGSAGSPAAFKAWSDYSHARSPHSVQLLPLPRGESTLRAGARITNEDSTVRATVTSEVAPDAEEIVYTLDPSSPGDFQANSFVFEANALWKKASPAGDGVETVFRVDANPPKAASTATADSPVTELAEVIREQFWMATCLTPYVVMCSLDKSKLDCTIPLAENIQGTSADTACGHRAAAAWRNYHACIEIARQEVAEITGGDALVVELLVEGHVSTPYAQVGYGLREFEIDVVSRKPGQAVKRGIDKNVLAQTFRTFDADGSGAVDADELKSAAQKLGIPMTDEDVEATMADLGKSREDEINKKEFIKWFESLSQAVRGALAAASKCCFRFVRRCLNPCDGAERAGRIADGTDSALIDHLFQLSRVPVHQPHQGRGHCRRRLCRRDFAGHHAIQLRLPRHAKQRRAAAVTCPPRDGAYVSRSPSAHNRSSLTPAPLQVPVWHVHADGARLGQLLRPMRCRQPHAAGQHLGKVDRPGGCAARAAGKRRHFLCGCCSLRVSERAPCAGRIRDGGCGWIWRDRQRGTERPRQNAGHADERQGSGDSAALDQITPQQR